MASMGLAERASWSSFQGKEFYWVFYRFMRVSLGFGGSSVNVGYWNTCFQ